ncbi:hypothetical protein M5K25_015735 [Dendrobium thyrsiflorum]|uniref:Uncharacterized protein n=1 Tax=Dendrobium thyrsiflorum TaxID=117978 RepID=A0ABD0URV3_DENTH
MIRGEIFTNSRREELLGLKNLVNGGCDKAWTDGLLLKKTAPGEAQRLQLLAVEGRKVYLGKQAVVALKWRAEPYGLLQQKLKQETGRRKSQRDSRDLARGFSRYTSVPDAMVKSIL